MNNFLDLINDKTHFKIIVKSNSSKTQILSFDENTNSFKMSVKALPIEGRANYEIKKFFKKNYKLKVEIISGNRSKQKLLKII